MEVGFYCVCINDFLLLGLKILIYINKFDS